METLVWLRVPADIIFGAGALLLIVFMLRLSLGKRRAVPMMLGMFGGKSGAVVHGTCRKPVSLNPDIDAGTGIWHRASFPQRQPQHKDDQQQRTGTENDVCGDA